MNDNDRQLLKDQIALFQYDVSDEQRNKLLDVVKTVDPKGYEHLIKSQCAYEFHMILEAILDPLPSEDS